jgi:hypothetical protein
MATESLVDITVRSLSSPEPDVQRGRKRRRDVVEVSASRSTIKSSESATFRGRCRYRSTSRYLDVSSLSRPTSRHRLLQGHHRNASESPSPSRRKLLRIMQLTEARHRSQSPSRSRSPLTAHINSAIAQDTPKRRRQRTRSRSRPHHTSMSVSFDVISSGGDVKITAVEAVVHAPTTCELLVPNEVSATKLDYEQG